MTGQTESGGHDVAADAVKHAGGLVTVTNSQSGTNVHEVAEGIFRINTPVVIAGGDSFSFNQYLIVDDEPLLFHTGPRKMFPLVREAVASILPIERLRYIGFSHVEADECGSLNEWLAVAPQSVPVCGKIAALGVRKIHSSRRRSRFLSTSPLRSMPGVIGVT